MNFRQIFISSLTTLVLSGLMATGPVMAQDPEVQSATPSSAYQGTFDLDVEIAGSNFGRGASVRFLEADSDVEAEGVVVRNVKVRGSNKLIVTLDIKAVSYVGDTDIEVTISDRKGKGTTLFKVQSSNTQTSHDGDSIPMICALNETPDSMTTMGNDINVNPDPSVGSPFYFHGLEAVLCHSGDVTQDRLAGLRLRTDAGGNLGRSERFFDINFAPSCGDDVDCNSHLPDAALLERLPVQLKNASPDSVHFSLKPYEDTDDYIGNHIQLMTPGVEYPMRLNVEVVGLGERYLFRMMNRAEVPQGQLPSFTCPFDPESGVENVATDDVNVYIWLDGVFSPPADGRPDGYTVTTGVIDDVESLGNPPTVTAEWKSGLICSNVSLTGEACPRKKDKNKLCYNLGKVPMRFTMHMEYE